MDPALLRERELFKKKALHLPSVEKRKRPAPPASTPSPSSAPHSKRQRVAAANTVGVADVAGAGSWRAYGGSSQLRFSILSRIVRYMKMRHLDGDYHPLSVEEILDETNQTDISFQNKNWLSTEALPNNPKIEVVEPAEGGGGSSAKLKFVYKPKYKIRDKKTLLKLLERHHSRGQGGVLLEDVEEVLPNAKKSVASLGNYVLTVTRPDKREVLFYRDRSVDYQVEEEIKKIWNTVGCEEADDRKVEEYLTKHGIATMEDLSAGRSGGGEAGAATSGGKKGQKRASSKKRAFKRLNEHMTDVLVEVDELKAKPTL